MRSHEVFARMSPEQAERLLGELSSGSPATATLVQTAIAEAFKLRPRFLRAQPRTRQADWMRKVLSRPTSAATAEEVLASYFLDQHPKLLHELLDKLGVEHEEGRLLQDHPDCPATRKLRKAVGEFLDGDEPARRRLLLEAFAAQSAIQWPALEKLLESGPPSSS